jgi:DNA-cytosine methyltransferase
MNVLSLFDGMSCGQQALERAGIKVDNYYASEIDKYAIQVTMANYPNTIQLGSVVDVNGYDLPKIDLLIGGSPCQSFSFAGKRKGMSTKDEQEILNLEHYLQLKSEGYEFEGQSYLFWEYMRLIYEVKPKYFLLENVMMGEKWEKVLSKAIGVTPIMINSSLVSAQNRKRLYWTNIGMESAGLFGYPVSIIDQPKDKGILLKDIIESEVDEKYFLKQNFKNERLKTNLIKNKNELKDLCLLDSYNQAIYYDKSITINTRVNASSNFHIYQTRETNAVKIIANGCKEQVIGRKAQPDGTYKRKYEISNDEKSKTLETNKHKNNVSIGVRKVNQLNTSLESGGVQPYQQNRVYDSNGIMTALDLDSSRKSVYVDSQIRRLTPIECERLQTVKDNYTNCVSDTQRYRMLGNGWTVDVIAHIFGYLK